MFDPRLINFTILLTIYEYISTNDLVLKMLQMVGHTQATLDAIKYAARYALRVTQIGRTFFLHIFVGL